jgi:hypothetical protein
MPPLEFRISVTTYPFFHPKDVPTLTEVIGIQNCKVYAYCDGRSGSWTITSLPMKLKGDTEIIQLRSRDVTICPDLKLSLVRGSLARKRTLSSMGSPELDLPETVTKKGSFRQDSDDDEGPPPSSSPAGSSSDVYK